MAIEFYPGHEIQRGDLDIWFQDSNQVPMNVYEITYAIYWVDPGPPETEVLIGNLARVPVNPQIGEYYAALFVPPSAPVGTYRIRWTFTEYSGGPLQEVVMEFSVIGKETFLQSCNCSSIQAELVHDLRMLLRDHNPDKFYHFRPPEHEGRIGQFNRVFGQIWENQELCLYLRRALDWWNMAPPETEWLSTVDRLVMEKRAWRMALFIGAAYWALFALALNWVADEFSLAGETLVKVYLSRVLIAELSLSELHAILYAGAGEEEGEAGTLRKAFRDGTLEIQSVELQTGKVRWSVLKDVLRHQTGHKEAVKVTLVDTSSVVCTEDHSLFSSVLLPLPGKEIKPGMELAVVDGEVVIAVEVASVEAVEPLEVSYDLSVPGDENFALENGILAHNSYSIGGISLDIDKSSKYESLKSNVEGQWAKLVEQKLMTTKFIRGLAQPRFGVGVRSSFGPAVGRGVLSPRSFV